MKDIFSVQAASYARYRPGYPDSLFDYLRHLCVHKDAAWDCATGNGQIAGGLSAFFSAVMATDISEQQLSHAVAAPNITYRREAAESSSFDDAMFDLVIVAQAIHWFRFDEFYKEVKRTLKPGGIFVVTGYSMVVINPEIDALLLDYHENIVGAYWDPERIYVDERYQTIPFPFNEIEAPQLAYKDRWSLERLCGYVDSWSATQHYIKATGTDPVPLLKERLRQVWGPSPDISLTFPLLLRAGRL
jgi:SAM-dependent methyltransferase